MSFKDLQADVDRWVSQYKEGYWTPHQIYARLGEEVGEVGREINHLFGPKPKKDYEAAGDLGEEIADVVFSLCCLANSQGIDLDEAWQKMMKKTYTRDDDRFVKEDRK